jgi:membrane protein
MFTTIGTIATDAVQAEQIQPKASVMNQSHISEAWAITKEAVTAWVDDFAPSMGAALAYYTIFSLAPMLIIVIAIAGFFYGQNTAQWRGGDRRFVEVGQRTG